MNKRSKTILRHLTSGTNDELSSHNSDNNDTNSYTYEYKTLDSSYTYTYESCASERLQQDFQVDNKQYRQKSNNNTLFDSDYGRRQPTHWNAWGYSDTKFEITPNRTLTLTGSRYDFIFDGNTTVREFPEFVEWAELNLGINVDGGRPPVAPPSPEEYPMPNVNQGFVETLKQQLEVVMHDVVLTTDDSTDEPLIVPQHVLEIFIDGPSRLRRSHGHTCAEIYPLVRGIKPLPKIPDMVVCPQTQQHVEAIVKAAGENNVMIIPVGGGTSVSNALNVPQNEKRSVVAVCMKRMNRILWVNRDNMTACIQPGILGIELEKRLGTLGLTMGHEPDSLEFSTLGGWVATKSSGMKKNSYGNIENIVLSTKLVTTEGVYEQKTNIERQSSGPDMTRLVIGSEGCLGIISEVTVRIRNKVNIQKHGSVVFPSFKQGINAMREVSLKRALPSSIRLMDNAQFKMGQALKPKSSAPEWQSNLMDKAKKFYVTDYHGLDPDKLCAMTLLFEGDSAQDISAQERAVYSICRRHGGVRGDSNSGSRGYKLTWMIAYLRDFGLGYNFMSESFETSVPWSNVTKVYDAVLTLVPKKIESLGVRVKPLMGGRITLAYDTCAVIYFYFGFIVDDLEDPVKGFHEIEHYARQVILDNGGSLSHHHGVGKLRKPFLEQTMSQMEMETLKMLKDKLDPKQVFGVGNFAW